MCMCRGETHKESPWEPRQRKQQAGPEGASPPYISRSPGGLRLDPRVSSTAAVVSERRLQGNTCRGRMRWALGSTHLRTGGARVRRGPRSPGPTVPGFDARPRCQMGEGDTGSYDTYLAAPTSPPAAATEPATPGTIFRRRLVLGGGYQPPIRHRQPTQLPASRCLLRPRTPGGREGSARRRDAVRPLGSGSGAGGQGTTACQSRGAGATSEPRGTAEGSAGPPTRPPLGLLLSTLSLPPRSMPGIGGGMGG